MKSREELFTRRSFNEGGSCSRQKYFMASAVASHTCAIFSMAAIERKASEKYLIQKM